LTTRLIQPEKKVFKLAAKKLGTITLNHGGAFGGRGGQTWAGKDYGQVQKEKRGSSKDKLRRGGGGGGGVTLGGKKNLYYAKKKQTEHSEGKKKCASKKEP